MILDCTKKYLADGYPELVREWSDKNGDYKPTDFTAGSSKKVWWKCHVCGYEWKAMIYNRVQGRCECPACKRAKQIERAIIKEKYLIDMRKFEKHLREACLLYYFDKSGYELIIRLIRILEAGCRTYDNCMCLQCDDESLESYDWALISMFDVLGITMNVDCERDMREMFLWYQKYLDNRKVLYRNKNK